MKQNAKKKALGFLYKYQLGGQVDDTLMQDPYDYAPDLQTAQAEQMVQSNKVQSQIAYQPAQKNINPSDFSSMLSPGINLGIGVKNFIDSFGEKKRQRQFERAYKNDLDKRMNQMRVEGYYNVPYQYEEGGSIPDRYKNMGFNKVGQKKDSTIDGKKWMVLAKKGDDYKVVHGGYEGMKDYTQHKDEDRRERFWDRMGGKDSAKAKDPFSPLYWHKRFGTWQKGGQLNSLDMFMDMYNEDMFSQQNQFDQFKDYYEQKNEGMRDAWMNKRNNSLKDIYTNTIGFAQEAAKTALSFQDGGAIRMKSRKERERVVYGPDGKERISLAPQNVNAQGYAENNPRLGLPMRDTSAKSKSKDRFKEYQEGGDYDPRKDLYSPEYDPQMFSIIENEIDQAQVEDKELGAIEQWLFEDDPQPELEMLNESYFNDGGSVIDKIQQMESGGNPNAINPTTNATGLFQFVPKYWAGQIKSFMGLPQTFNQEQVMESFRKNPETQRQFMNHVVTNIYQPELEKVRPLARRYGFTDDQVIRLFHYRGIADAKKRLQTGDFSVSPEEKTKYKNPDILTYLNK